MPDFTQSSDFDSFIEHEEIDQIITAVGEGEHTLDEIRKAIAASLVRCAKACNSTLQDCYSCIQGDLSESIGLGEQVLDEVRHALNVAFADTTSSVAESVTQLPVPNSLLVNGCLPTHGGSIPCYAVVLQRGTSQLWIADCATAQHDTNLTPIVTYQSRECCQRWIDENGSMYLNQSAGASASSNAGWNTEADVASQQLVYDPNPFDSPQIVESVQQGENPLPPIIQLSCTPISYTPDDGPFPRYPVAWLENSETGEPLEFETGPQDLPEPFPQILNNVGTRGRYGVICPPADIQSKGIADFNFGKLLRWSGNYPSNYTRITPYDDGQRVERIDCIAMGGTPHADFMRNPPGVNLEGHAYTFYSQVLGQCGQVASEGGIIPCPPCPPPTPCPPCPIPTPCPTERITYDLYRRCKPKENEVKCYVLPSNARPGKPGDIWLGNFESQGSANAAMKAACDTLDCLLGESATCPPGGDFRFLTDKCSVDNIEYWKETIGILANKVSDNGGPQQFTNDSMRLISGNEYFSDETVSQQEGTV